MVKNIKELTYEQKNNICEKHFCDTHCPLNFKNNKTYCKAYFACWMDVEEEHIEHCKKMLAEEEINVDEELQKLYQEQDVEVDEDD